MSKFAANQEVRYNGQVVTIDSIKSGWATLILKNGSTRKARVSELEALKTPKAAPAEKPAKEPRAPKAAKEPKAPREKAPTKASKFGTAEDDRLVKADLAHYQVADVATPSGRKILDVGDDVAVQLRNTDLKGAYKLASEASGRSVKELTEKYQHLNPGMQRMNLGNLIRGGASKAERDKDRAAREAARMAKREAAAKQKESLGKAKGEQKAGYQPGPRHAHPKH